MPFGWHLRGLPARGLEAWCEPVRGKHTAHRPCIHDSVRRPQDQACGANLRVGSTTSGRQQADRRRQQHPRFRWNLAQPIGCQLQHATWPAMPNAGNGSASRPVSSLCRFSVEPASFARAARHSRRLAHLAGEGSASVAAMRHPRLAIRVTRSSRLASVAVARQCTSYHAITRTAATNQRPRLQGEGATESPATFATAWEVLR